MKVLILLCALFVAPTTALPTETKEPDKGIVGSYNHTPFVGSAWEYRLTIKPDLSFGFYSREIFKDEITLFGGSDSVRVPVQNPKWVMQSSGIFQVGKCWDRGHPDILGNLMFYRLNGDECCVLKAQLGKHTLIKRIGGDKIGVCNGGVYRKDYSLSRGLAPHQ